MKRNLSRLADESFDILIVGGGIHGAAITREAAYRGLKTALIEQGDFGQATSANSLKIIHGGLRYLQQADIKRMRQSIKARQRFMQIAPHLVQPFPFLIPTYGYGMRGKEVMAAGLALNDLMSWDRNQNLPPSHHIPRGRVISRKACLTILPHLEKQGLTGGALWYDGLVANTERLTLEWVLAAAERDAVVANYVQAKALMIDQGTVRGVEAEDRLSQSRLQIRARWVINAVGPWLNALLEPASDPLPFQWTKGMNLIINRSMFSDYGVGLGGGKVPQKDQSPSGERQRLFFFVPWKGRTMIGTSYQRYQGAPDHCRLETAEIQAFLDEINAIYPPGKISLQEVSGFHYGLLPVSEGQDPANRQVEPDKHFCLIDHEPTLKAKGLISVKGTKYTTSLMVAGKVIDLISVVGKGGAPSPDIFESPDRYNIFALLNDLNQINPGTHPDVQGELARHLYQNYGATSKKIMDYWHQDREMGRLISVDPVMIAAEIVHGIREEMALKLSDVVFRRTDMGQFRCPTLESLWSAARIMAKELDWDGNRTHHEVQEVLAVFRPLQPNG
jgi:glycerol-3-phosphate dehydrogenase